MVRPRLLLPLAMLLQQLLLSAQAFAPTSSGPGLTRGVRRMPNLHCAAEAEEKQMSSSIFAPPEVLGHEGFMRRRTIRDGSMELCGRVAATPEDWEDIATLRMAVFGDKYHEGIHHRLIKRGLNAMAERRRKGAVSLALRNKEFQLLGSLECSRHEFVGSSLERSGFENVYITELAVAEEYRGLGVGTELMVMGLDLACELGGRSAYLHVSEVNIAAIRLYESAGFEEVGNSPSIYAFTASLGLSDGFIGKRHLLLKKELGRRRRE
jgi:ribosomal protein S18 acetylase RimI-like enzyme